MYKILVTSKSFAKYNSEIIKNLNEHGIEIERPDKQNLSSKEISDIIESYDGIICGIDNIDKDVIKAGKNLKIIHMNGTGADLIDIKEATKHGIFVGNCPGANATAVAELNLSILLAEARGIIKHSNLVYQNRWERKLGIELSNKVMGIIGLGFIGRKFVELLKGFNMRILAFEPYPEKEWVSANNIELVDNINIIFKESDFISLHLPLLKSTKNMINEDSFKLMKSDTIIVNTSRGGLINTDDLVEAIKNRKIKGAALDAFAKEPLEKDSELLELDITLTPHLGASTIETSKNVSQRVCKNIIDVLINHKFEHMINNKDIKELDTKLR